MACITKRHGRWIIDFYDNQGNRQRKTLPEKTTKTKAKEALRDIENQLEKGNYLPDKKVPLFTDVAESWLEFKRPNVRQSTWQMYKGHLKHHFSDVDKLKVSRITTARVEKFITDRQKNGMNITTLRKIIITFNQVMNYAVRHKYINHNPVRDAERPKGQGKERDPQIKILTPSEINSFLENVKHQKYRVLFMLAIMSGARQGELLGLKWTDVDWFNNQIHIQRTFNNGAWYQPKSKTSNRKVDLGPAMMAELKRWKMACPPNELDLVFPNSLGKGMNHGNMLRRHFWPSLEAAGCPKIRFHDLRH